MILLYTQVVLTFKLIYTSWGRFSIYLKTFENETIIMFNEVKNMSIKKKSWEVHFSRIIGIFIIITGLLILFNAPRIKDYNIKDSANIHIRNI